jgi:photosystem II stability/assembly factor-like uncharacterized protein
MFARRALLTGLICCGLWLAAAVPVVQAETRDLVDQPADQEPLASRSLLLDVARAGKRLVAVGERGHVLLSDDEGLTWTQARSVPSRTMLTAVTFADAEHGWAVGHDEIILNTSDGGQTWTRSHYAPESQQPLLDVYFADAQRGLAVGAYGSFFVTSDGGASWAGRKFEAKPLQPAKAADAQEIPPDYHLNKIAAANSRLYIAAEAGQIYRSDDGGQTWITLPSPYNGSFFGLLPLEGDSLLIFGLRGNLFRSDDAGLSWRKIDSAVTAMLTDGVRLADGRVVLTGLSGVVLVSAPGGANLVLRQEDDRKGLSAVLATSSADELVLVGEGGSKRVALNKP